MTRPSRFHADHILILQGTSWVILFVLLGRLVIAAKEIAIASEFGVSGVVDAYQVGLTAASWLPSTLATALSVVLVPIFTRARIVSAESEALFVREVQGVFFAFGLLLTLITLWVGVFYVNQIADTLSAETLKLAMQFTRWLSPMALFMLMIGVLTARLQSRGKQLNTLFECIPALIILICILLPLFSMGSDALLWGTLAGFLLNLIFLFVAAGKDGIGWKGVCRMTSPHWPEVYKAVGVMTLGSFVMSFIMPLDQYMAAQLGEGAIATLGYANRFLVLGLGAGTLVITRGVMPVLANATAEGKNDHARLLAIKWALLLLIAGAVVVAAGWFLAPAVVRLLFERGAFTATDTAAVATCLRWGLLQVPFYISALVLVQLLVTRSRYRAIAFISAGNFIIKALLNFALVPYWGLAGIMIATSVMYVFAFVAFWLCIIYIKN